jgi:hypothetical protein
MKKDKFDMSNLGLPTKPQIVAPSGSNTQTILAKAVENIHKSPEPEPVAVVVQAPPAVVVQPEPTPAEPTKLSGDIKKVSMDLPMEMYKAVKYYAVESGVSMKDYIARLIQADMETRKPK